MFSQRQFIAGAIILCSSGVLAAQVARHPPSPPPPPPAALTATTDCRAGCQGGEGNCQQSMQKAVFVASPGYRLIAGSQSIIRHWNASDSPGLRAEPRWHVEPLVDEGKLIRVTISPVLASCVGVSPHTQGVTFYEFQMLQRP